MFLEVIPEVEFPERFFPLVEDGECSELLFLDAGEQEAELMLVLRLEL